MLEWEAGDPGTFVSGGAAQTNGESPGSETGAPGRPGTPDPTLKFGGRWQHIAGPRELRHQTQSKLPFPVPTGAREISLAGPQRAMGQDSRARHSDQKVCEKLKNPEIPA